MKKLSELLRELADHAENAENKAAAAEKDTSEKVHAAVDTSKAEAKARQDEFKSNVAKKKAAASSDWKKLQAEHNQRVEKIKSNIAPRKTLLIGSSRSTEPMTRRTTPRIRFTLLRWQLTMLRSPHWKPLRLGLMQNR